MVDNGYFLLSRSILDSNVFASPTLLKTWIWCLSKANYKAKTLPLRIGGGESFIEIERGSFLFGRNSAADQLAMNSSMVYRNIKKLEKLKMIEIKSNNQYSVITICKYDHYQSVDTYKRTSNELDLNLTRTRLEPDLNTTNTLNKDNTLKHKEYKFILFWDSYHQITGKKKTDKEPTLKYWKKMSESEKEKALQNIEPYFLSLSDKKYCKKARTYLADKNYNDEFQAKKSINPVDIDNEW